METMLEAVGRLQALGYDVELRAAPGGPVHCPACDRELDASIAGVDYTVRFEGDSNTDDESVLVALTLPCGLNPSPPVAANHRRQWTRALRPRSGSGLRVT